MHAVYYQGYSLRIALMVNGVHESKIYFAVQLGVNKLVSGRVKTFVMRRDVLWNRFFTPRCEVSKISRRPYRGGFEYEVGTHIDELYSYLEAGFHLIRKRPVRSGWNK